MGKTAFTPEEADAIRLLVEHQADLGIEGMTAAEVEEAVLAKGYIVAIYDHGIAVLRPENAAAVPVVMPFLWMLWVRPEARGAGHGRAMLKDIRRRYSREYKMTLHCFGADRRRFFGRDGFRVVERVEETRTMER